MSECVDSALPLTIIDLRDCDRTADEIKRVLREPTSNWLPGAPPGLLHQEIGTVHADMQINTRRSVALAMRQLHVSTQYDREIAAAERAAAAVTPASVDLGEARSRLASADKAVTALRERVARLGGRVAALEETKSADPTEARQALETAATKLAERETEREAAAQALQRARQEARTARSARERKRQFEDRAANRRRDAHASLLSEGWDRIEAAVGAIPGPGAVAGKPPSWTGPVWHFALALARLADLKTPIIIVGELPETVIDPALYRTPIIRVEV